MCTEGVNLTQFKLSLHQLSQFVQVCQESLRQWEDLLNRLEWENLARRLKEGQSLIEEAKASLDKLLEETSQLEHQADEDVEITPL
jgi:ABC-type transporter Mla subunit MlaD